MTALVAYILVIARREKLVAALMLALAAVALASAFLGRQSLIEQRETAMALGLHGMRLVIVLGMAVFACVLVERWRHSGELLVLLARPLSRGAFVASVFTALMSVGLVLALAADVLALALLGATPSEAGQFLAAGLAETGMMVAFALFAALGMATITPALLLVAGFFILLRLAGSVSRIAASPFRDDASHLGRIALHLAEWTGRFLPAIGNGEVSGLVMLQAGVFAALLVICAGFDLTRKRF